MLDEERSRSKPFAQVIANESRARKVRIGVLWYWTREERKARHLGRIDELTRAISALSCNECDHNGPNIACKRVHLDLPTHHRLQIKQVQSYMNSVALKKMGIDFPARSSSGDACIQEWRHISP